MSKETVDPDGLCGGGAADAEAGADALGGARGAIVELIVSGLLRIAGPEVDVRLVPDFKIPLRDFVFAVTRDEMTCEVFDELLPLVPVLGRRDILLVPESVKGAGIRGELLGHEAELDERADVVLEEAVVNLVDVGEVVNGMAIFVLVVEADFVVEDGVEA